jgi:hypothetical protein
VDTRTARIGLGMAVQNVRQTFQHLTGRVLQQPAGWFGLHSLRAGAATTMEEDGWALSEIMHAGRWRSATVLQYVRNGEQVAQVLGGEGRIPVAVRDL